MFGTKLAKVLLNLTKAAAKDITKPALQCWEIKDGVLSLTDGHRIVNIPAKDKINGCYHHTDIETATKVAVAKKTEVMVSSSGEPRDVQYPHWEQLIPNTDDYSKVTLNAEYLKEMCELAIAGGKSMLDIHVAKPEADERLGLAPHVQKPVMFFFEVRDEVGRGLIMPIQRREGMLEWAKAEVLEPPTPEAPPEIIIHNQEQMQEIAEAALARTSTPKPALKGKQGGVFRQKAIAG